MRRVNDVYKRAVYYHLARYPGDEESIKELLDNVDDFLWFKLNSLQFGGDEYTTTTASSSYSASAPSLSSSLSAAAGIATGATSAGEFTSLRFSELQAKLSIEYGEVYFTKNRNPFTYLQVTRQLML